MNVRGFIQQVISDGCNAYTMCDPFETDYYNKQKAYEEYEKVLNEAEEHIKQIVLDYHKYLQEELNVDLHEIWVAEYFKQMKGNRG